jgi:hypothetical protein
MNDADFLLRILSDGKPHSQAEILRRSAEERGCGLTVHSRASDLRKRGYPVVCTIERRNGRAFSYYQLLSPQASEPEPQSDLENPSDERLGLVDAAASGPSGSLGASSEPSLSHPNHERIQGRDGSEESQLSLGVGRIRERFA